VGEEDVLRLDVAVDDLSEWASSTCRGCA
jgi:hypothetical protein